MERRAEEARLARKAWVFGGRLWSLRRLGRLGRLKLEKLEKLERK